MKEIKDLKMQKVAALEKMDANALTQELKSAEKNMYVLKMKLAMGELKQTHLVKILRRYIAIIHTRLTTVKN